MRYSISSNVFNDGYTRRQKPRVEVLRGYDPVGDNMLTAKAEVADETVIHSGQVMSLDGNGKWVLGLEAGQIPYIALSDSYDTDVNSAGFLTGLSCVGNYEFQIGWFDSTGTYNDGTPLKASGTTPGNVVNTTWGSGDVVLGVVTRGGVFNLNEGEIDGETVRFPQRENNAEETDVLAFNAHFALNPS